MFRFIFKLLLFPFIVLWRLVLGIFRLVLLAQLVMFVLSLVALGALAYFLDQSGIISVKDFMAQWRR